MNSSFLAGLLAAVMSANPISAAELETTTAELKELPREFRLDGVVEAINRTTVSAQTSGQVQDILFDVDDYVEEGQVVAVLKDTEHQAGVTRAAADLKEAVARLEEARDEHKRTKEVFAKKLVPQATMDRSKAALKSARARFEAAQAGLAQANEKLDYTQVKAPYTGVVTERHVQVGEIAQPGQRLISGVSLDKLRVLVDVPQSLVTRIREFGKARVLLPGNGFVDATKLTVFPFADKGSNTFKVRVELPEGTNGVFPGMFVKTSFVTGVKQELLLPHNAVVYRSEVTGVYVVDADGKVHFRHVRLGRKVAEGVMVLAGVNPGDKVAVDPIAAAVELKRQRSVKTENDDG